MGVTATPGGQERLAGRSAPGPSAARGVWAAEAEDVLAVDRALEQLLDDYAALGVDPGDVATLSVRNGLLLEARGPLLRRLGLIALRRDAFEAVAAAVPGLAAKRLP